jgi:nitrogen fixation-related uncharacterized protein
MGTAGEGTFLSRVFDVGCLVVAAIVLVLVGFLIDLWVLTSGVSDGKRYDAADEEE